MIRVSGEFKDVDKIFDRLQLALADKSFDQPVERAALKCLRELVLLTPKGYTGDTRKHWQIDKPQDGARVVFNDSKVMRFLEGGTGLTTGGYIYPKFKKVLFVPLNARASIGGWNKGLVYGVDYVLAKRVRGIQPMRIVENFKPRANDILQGEMKEYLQKILT